ncbi:MAG: TonB-dependent receptor [Gammaproteobacteria bacterium]|nr:TonB-dependent receptor [Gammaproteobacteria bacterium]
MKRPCTTWDWKGILDRRFTNWQDDTAGGWNEGNWNNFTENHTFLNEGDGLIKGLELTTSYDINEIWTIGGNFTLQDAAYDSYCAPQATNYFTSDTPPLNTVLPILTRDADDVLVDCGRVDGNALPRIADFDGVLSVDARLPNEFWNFRTSFSGKLIHEGSNYDDPLNLIGRKGVTRLNFSARMHNRQLGLTIRFYANNLTDEEDPDSWVTATSLGTIPDPTVRPTLTRGWQVTPRRPREIGVTAVYEFKR